jgi:hypothetical protein
VAGWGPRRGEEEVPADKACKAWARRFPIDWEPGLYSAEENGALFVRRLPMCSRREHILLKINLGLRH